MLFEFSAGVIVYTYREGKRHFLFLKRDNEYDMPKGRFEKDEKALDAAIRETREEAGLDVKPDRYFKDEVEYWKTKNGEKIKKHVTFFLAHVPANSAVKTSFEHTGYEWMTFGQALEKLSFDNQKEFIKRTNEYIDRLEEMEALNKEYAELPKKHPPWGLSGAFVPGHGPLNAKIFFIGQAPGRQEDQLREPFIGMAGQLLNKLIHRAGLKREGVYITSVVQFFPPDNRLPTEEEAMHCMPFLKRQIKILKPRLLVVLGNFSAMNVVGIGQITSNHGRIIKSEEYGCDVFVTLHPAAAVRIKANLPIMEQDFDKLKEIVKDF